MNEQLLKRLKSFGWRTLCVAIIAVIGYATDNLGLFEIPVWLQGIIGLGLGEITKWFNSNTALFGNKNPKK